MGVFAAAAAAAVVVVFVDLLPAHYLTSKVDAEAGPG